MENNNYELSAPRVTNEDDTAHYDTITGSEDDKRKVVRGTRTLLRLQVPVLVCVVVTVAICVYLVYVTLPPHHEAGPRDGLKEGPTATVFRDCEDHRRAGRTVSGQYDITLLTGRQVSVICDMEADGGGWSMLLRRTDGSVNFNRLWKSYQNGFGNGAEFWLGNDIMHELTSQRQYKLRIDMTSNINGTRFATYDIFHVANETAKYELTVGGYHGDAGDAFNYHNGSKFTTVDQDNDAHNTSNCAGYGGWWYGRCFKARMTGLYGRDIGIYRGITWAPWLGHNNFLDYADMKIRPLK